VKLTDATEATQSLLDAPSPATITVYDTDGEAVVSPVWFRVNDGAEARLAIASRYLGAESGRRYADIERRPPGDVVSLPVADGWTWDLHSKQP